MKRAAVALGAIALGAIAFLAWGRVWPGFGTETDFVGAFAPDALRLIEGEPMRLRYHPPLYSVALALFSRIGGDLFAGGRILSWLAGALLIGAAWAGFSRLAGRPAGLGAVGALAVSPLFLRFGAQATSDVFAAALVYAAVACLLLAFAAPRTWRWITAGALLGASLLVRTNAVSFLLLLAAPLLTDRARGRRAAAVCCGVALPVLCWWIFANATGAPFAPAGGLRDNLALTYFADRDLGAGSEGMATVTGRFDGVLDVLARDPAHVARTYLGDAVGAARRIFFGSALFLFPANLLALAGLAAWVSRLRDPASAGLILVVGAQAALVNLKTFEPRFWLFLVPFLGAGAGLALAKLPRRELWAAAAIVVSLGPVAYRLPADHAALRARDPELDAVIPALGRRLHGETGAAIVARKGHVGFYNGLVTHILPVADDPAALERWMRNLEPPVGWLYFGSEETRRRPGLRSLAHPDRAPVGFEPVARGPEGGGWVLYRIYSPSSSSSSPGTSS